MEEVSSKDRSMLAKLSFNGYHIDFEQLGHLNSISIYTIEDAERVAKVLGVVFPHIYDLLKYYQDNKCSVIKIRDNSGTLLWPS